MSSSLKMESHNLTGQTFGYTAAGLDYLAEEGTTEYTLVTLVVDESSSVSAYRDELERCLQEAVKSCRLSPRADYLLLRVLAFNQNYREIHGFKPLVDCNTYDYIGCLHPSGMTALYYTDKNAITATIAYGVDLEENDFTVNALIITITDGMDNRSERDHGVSSSDVKDDLAEANRNEALESILTVLVGVGTKDDPDISRYLEDFKNEAGMAQYIDIEDADEKSLARLSDFISRSVSSQSQALGSGKSSQPLAF